MHGRNQESDFLRNKRTNETFCRSIERSCLKDVDSIALGERDSSKFVHRFRFAFVSDSNVSLNKSKTRERENTREARRFTFTCHLSRFAYRIVYSKPRNDAGHLSRKMYRLAPLRRHAFMRIRLDRLGNFDNRYILSLILDPRSQSLSR